MMDKAVILVAIATLWLVGEGRCEIDCETVKGELIAKVSNPNVTTEECIEARKAWQAQITACNTEPLDPFEEYIINVDFVIQFADDGDCANTPGSVEACHDVPNCERTVIIPGSKKLNCGKDNELAKKAVECNRKLYEEGCHLIGPESLVETALKQHCGYVREDNSSAARFLVSSAFLFFSLLLFAA